MTVEKFIIMDDDGIIHDDTPENIDTLWDEMLNNPKSKWSGDLIKAKLTMLEIIR